MMGFELSKPSHLRTGSGRTPTSPSKKVSDVLELITEGRRSIMLNFSPLFMATRQATPRQQCLVSPSTVRSNVPVPCLYSPERSAATHKRIFSLFMVIFYEATN